MRTADRPCRARRADPGSAAEVLACQRAGYAVEAELIGFDGTPPLRETPEELIRCGERFVGSYDPDGLADIVSWKKLADGTVDICRLVMAPRAFHMGHASALLDALALTEPAERPFFMGSAIYPTARSASRGGALYGLMTLQLPVP